MKGLLAGTYVTNMADEAWDLIEQGRDPAMDQYERIVAAAGEYYVPVVTRELSPRPEETPIVHDLHIVREPDGGTTVASV